MIELASETRSIVFGMRVKPYKRLSACLIRGSGFSVMEYEIFSYFIIL